MSFGAKFPPRLPGKGFLRDARETPACFFQTTAKAARPFARFSPDAKASRACFRNATFHQSPLRSFLTRDAPFQPLFQRRARQLDYRVKTRCAGRRLRLETAEQLLQSCLSRRQSYLSRRHYLQK